MPLGLRFWSLLLFVSFAMAQAPVPTGAVMGHVLCTDTQQPARLAHVVLQPLVDRQATALDTPSKEYRSEGLFRLQTVGLDGSFAIASVPEGTYYVIAEQDGYVSPLSLFTREQLNKPTEAMLRNISRFLTPIRVTAGHTTQAEVRLIRGASIAGKVNFEDGALAVNVGVTLMQKDANGKWKQARTNQLASHLSGYTDDQGTYRFTGLPGGEYLVRATVELNNVILDHIFASGGSTSFGDGYHLQVFPGDTFRVSDAKPVKVEEGEVAAAVNVDVPLSRLHSLSGTVLRPASTVPVNAARLTLDFADNGDELTSTEVRSDDGTFRFDFVPEGNYTLRATNVAEVQWSEVSTCKGCIPPTHTEKEVLERYGNTSLQVKVSSDQSGVTLEAKPFSAKADGSTGQ